MYKSHKLIQVDSKVERPVPDHLKSTTDYTHLFPAGFALRPPSGKTYGCQWILPKYEDDIQRMFEYGELVSGEKYSSAEMQEFFLKTFKEEYRQPTTYGLQAKMSGLFASSKKKKVKTRVEINE